MYDVLSSSFVVSYNTSSSEHHINSSEFEDKREVKALKWRKLLVLVTSETYGQKENSEKLFLYKVNTNPEKCKRTRDLIAEMSNNISNAPEFSMEKLLNCHNYDEDSKSGNHIKTCQSGKSAVSKKTSKFLTKPQMFPCISKMLSNSTKRVEKKFKEISVGTNGEFSCARCERRRIKKLRRRMFYDTFSPYYNIGDNKPLEIAHGLRSPLFYNARTFRNHISAASSSSLTSIESDLEYIPWQGSRKHVKRHILRKQMHATPKRKILKNKKQQCPSRIRNPGPFRIIATPCWEEDISNNCQSTANPCNELQSTTSSFWDYIIDKIAKKQMKHHDQDIDSVKCCPCRQSLKAEENLKSQTCECKKVQTSTCVTGSQTTSTVEKKPSIKQIPNQNKTTTKTDESFLNQPCKNTICDRFSTIHAVSRVASQNSKTTDKMFPTSSTSEKLQQAKPKEPDEGGSKKPKVDKAEKTCQASHEAILKKLKQKYHGEVLCIHNPPCILINGCLNLPPPRVKPTTVCYPVTQIKKASVYNLYRRMWRQKLNKAPENVNSKFAYIPSNVRLPARNVEDIKHSFFQKHLCELVRMCSKPHFGVLNAANRRTKSIKKPPRLIQKKRSSHREHRQDPKKPKKIVVVTPGNEVETTTPSKSNVLSCEMDKSSGWPSSPPTRHKSRLLRMIRTKR